MSDKLQRIEQNEDEKNNSTVFGDLMVIIAKRLIGPAFLVVGLCVASYVLWREQTIAIDLLNEGWHPTIGLRALKIFLPLIVAYFGFLLMKPRPYKR